MWLGFGAAMQAALPDIIDLEQPITHVGVLLSYIAYSVLISIVAGFVCASIRKKSPMKTVWVYAVLLLVTGIAIEVASWELTPVWYHIVFLALIVPATVWGGVVQMGRGRG